MALSYIARLFTLVARLIGLLAAALILVTLTRGTLSYLSERANAISISDLGLLPLIVPAQILLAVWVGWNILKPGSRSLIFVLLVAFLGSFVVAYGWYFLLAPASFYVGVGNLMYLLAALFALGAWLSAIGTQPGEGRA